MNTTTVWAVGSALVLLVLVARSVRIVQQYERKATVNVRDYQHAVAQSARTSPRTIIGRADLDTLLSDRERISAELGAVIDGHDRAAPAPGPAPRVDA